MRNVIWIAALSLVTLSGCADESPVGPSAMPRYQNQLDFVLIESTGKLEECRREAERDAEHNRGPVPMPGLGCCTIPAQPAVPCSQRR
jgi:hypothetical protein